jgi:uncharacterized membrane protein
MIETPAAVLATLAGIAGFWFWLHQRTGWKLFQFIVPLLWIYATPMVLRNVGVLPQESATYDVLREFGLPIFIVLLLLAVDVGAAVRIMGRGIGVMLMGTVGVVLGAPVGYLAVKHWLDPEAWRGFGALAGSWIGGTGNLAAAAAMLDTPPEQFGLAVLADNVIYFIWLPLLLLSKNLAGSFSRWTRASPDRLARMEAAAAAEAVEKTAPSVQQLLYLAALAAGVTWFSSWLSPRLPEIDPILSTSTWTVLLVTTLGIALSFTPARRLPGSHELGMAVVYLFVARMGAVASLEGLAQAPAFLLGAFIWILIHGLFCLGGAWLFKVDVHSAAIASAANIGGAASVPVVAAYHRESLVPAGILMALIGYALGNYMAWVTGLLLSWVA